MRMCLTGRELGNANHARTEVALTLVKRTLSLSCPIETPENEGYKGMEEDDKGR